MVLAVYFIVHVINVIQVVLRICIVVLINKIMSVQFITMNIHAQMLYVLV